MPKSKAVAPSGPAERVLALGKELFKLKAEKDKHEGQLETINERIKQIAQFELPKLMEDAGIDKQTLTGMGTLYLGTDFYASVLKDDRPKLYDWMRENGHGALVQDYVFPKTLTSFFREQLENNQPVPEFVKATYLPVAKTRRA